MNSFWYSVNKHAHFTKPEITQLLITSVLAGFYLSFDNWGITEVSYSSGIQNFLGAGFALFFMLTIITIAQKLLGAFFGYKIWYEYSWAGLLVGFFITILTYGAFPFFLPGGIRYKLVHALRLGKFNPGYKYSEMWVLASLAVIIPLLLTIPFGMLYLADGSEMYRHLAITGLFLAAYSLIPLPHLKPLKQWDVHGITDLGIIKKVQAGTYGYDLFSFHMVAYVLLLVFSAVFIGLVLLFQIFSLVLTLIFGSLLLLVYYILINYLGK